MAANSPLRIAFLTWFVAGSLLMLAGVVETGRASAAVVPRVHRHEFRHEIDQMEDAWHDAMVKSDSVALGALLAEDYTGITANGAIQTKEQAVANLRSGALQISDLSTSDRKIRIYGATSVVTSLAEVTGGKNDLQISGRYRYTRVYVRNSQGQWKIVSFEASRIQDPGEHK
jgi:ketosteroid isomerase-like protein